MSSQEKRLSFSLVGNPETFEGRVHVSVKKFLAPDPEIRNQRQSFFLSAPSFPPPTIEATKMPYRFSERNPRHERIRKLVV
ncbi:hypothetical protein [Bryocella elongata]|uniref:hypothetical protein n=1 Tax=Bryocella elongata TaxID=863522 RepID=UPI0011B07FD8|nr:hypothetical protein [Bryocella elongata]